MIWKKERESSEAPGTTSDREKEKPERKTERNAYGLERALAYEDLIKQKTERLRKIGTIDTNHRNSLSDLYGSLPFQKSSTTELFLAFLLFLSWKEDASFPSFG